MTDCFEYIRLAVDLGDLGDLNALGSTGWHVVAWVPDEQCDYALLERRVPTELVHGVRSYWGKLGPRHSQGAQDAEPAAELRTKPEEKS